MVAEQKATHVQVSRGRVAWRSAGDVVWAYLGPTHVGGPRLGHTTMVTLCSHPCWRSQGRSQYGHSTVTPMLVIPGSVTLWSHGHTHVGGARYALAYLVDCNGESALDSSW
jgi:hypothetical protein